MGILIITIFVAVFSWTIFGFKKDKETNLGVILLLLGLFSSLVSVIMTATSVSQNHDFTSYKNVKWNVSKIQRIHVNDLPTVQAAISWNEIIERHRKNKDSMWVGIWYSAEVAALEPIKLPVEGD